MHLVLLLASVSTILAVHTDVDNATTIACTPLWIAAQEGKTALILAAQNGHTNVVRILVNDGGAHVNVQDGTGMSALHWAAQNGHTNVVHILVNDGGAHVNVQIQN